MRSKTVFVLILFTLAALCEAANSQSVETRGKKKKYHINSSLWIYVADLVVKKVFILKLVYAFVLWCVIHKAGYFLSWFVSYLKEKKHEDHHHHDHGHHHDHYSSYSPYRKSYPMS